MIKLAVAKSVMEKEEGMNHLCITFERSQIKVKNITIDIQYARRFVQNKKLKWVL
ncbi:hypothetical protein F6Y05_19075 [Bacillus megaterium]|nr:hypothetical protein [Priestia megaterium]